MCPHGRGSDPRCGHRVEGWNTGLIPERHQARGQLAGHSGDHGLQVSLLERQHQGAARPGQAGIGTATP